MLLLLDFVCNAALKRMSRSQTPFQTTPRPPLSTGSGETAASFLVTLLSQAGGTNLV